MPTIDAHGSLHDSQGRYANQDKPAAGFDLNAAPANSGDVTLTEADFLDNDELMFAQETLGPDASYIEVRELAAERATTAYREHRSARHDAALAALDAQPFKAPEFFDGRVAALRGTDENGNTIRVYRAGSADLSHEDGRRVRTPAEFRAAFPDGVLPDDETDGWTWDNNSWWEGEIEGDEHAEPIDYDTLDSAAVDLNVEKFDSALLGDTTHKSWT